MELNYQIPPHTDSDIEAIINFYITTDDCITQFYYPPDDSVPRQQIDQTDGAIFHEGYLKRQSGLWQNLVMHIFWTCQNTLGYSN